MLRVLLIGAALFCAEVVAHAAQTDPAAEQATSEDDFDRLYWAYDEHLSARRFMEALDSAEQIEPGAENRDRQAIVAAMRASALLGLKREEDARRLMAEAERLAPYNPHPSKILFIGALNSDHMDIAADAFDRLIGRFPDVVRELGFEAVGYFLRNESDDQSKRNEDRRVALARLGYGGEQSDGFTAGAIEILVKRRDIDGASDLLRYLDAPDQIQELLIQKHLAALWPALEAHAGPGMAKAIQSSVDAAARAYSAEPDWRNLIEYAEMLRQAGRANEAAALKAKLPSSAEELAKVDEEAGWAMNNIAFALLAAGRADDADSLFASLNEAPIEKGGWRVSMIINRVAFLIDEGQFERALPLLAGAEESAKREGNSYAQQLVRTLQYCAYHRTGRSTEATRIRPEMIKFAKEARKATIDKLLCTGELDDAERIALGGLSDESFETSFVRSLQRNPLVNDRPVVWSVGWASLRQRPAIAKEFDRLGRDLPDHLRVPTQE